LAIGYGTDTAAFDPRTGRAFSSNSDGTLSVVEEKPDHGFVDLGNVRTELGARTMAVNPATGRVFTMTAAVAQPPAPTSGPAPKLDFVSGTLHMLFYDPGSNR
ncbi:MAG TPA: hypothetical protein VGF36_07470, partial [Rhodopila sp.]